MFIDEDDWTDALSAEHRALKPRGYLAFDSRKPDGRRLDSLDSRELPSKV